MDRISWKSCGRELGPHVLPHRFGGDFPLIGTGLGASPPLSNKVRGCPRRRFSRTPAFTKYLQIISRRLACSCVCVMVIFIVSRPYSGSWINFKTQTPLALSLAALHSPRALFIVEKFCSSTVVPSLRRTRPVLAFSLSELIDIIEGNVRSC